MKLTKYKVVLIAAIFYVLFSFKVPIEPFEGKLFANDFSQKDIAEWFVYSCVCYLFLIFIGIVGIRRVVKTEDKAIFLALICDGVISIFSYIVFGYYTPTYLSALTNSIPLGIIIYPHIYGGNKS